MEEQPENLRLFSLPGERERRREEWKREGKMRESPEHCYFTQKSRENGRNERLKREKREKEREVV